MAAGEVILLRCGDVVAFARSSHVFRGDDGLPPPLPLSLSRFCQRARAPEMSLSCSVPMFPATGWLEFGDVPGGGMGGSGGEEKGGYNG